MCVERGKTAQETTLVTEWREVEKQCGKSERVRYCTSLPFSSDSLEVPHETGRHRQQPEPAVAAQQTSLRLHADELAAARAHLLPGVGVLEPEYVWNDGRVAEQQEL